uniref:OB domain-containing protein n=1 Tax=Populus trichocarpa TaxID=3694 RepID=A0A3N7GAQ2_POPTR
MYGSSQFDGSAAAFMGGGFMPTQTAHPPSDSSSISKNREARCLFPLTVKQISNLASNNESNFIIDGAEVNNVTIVGRVSHKEDKASEYTFLVDDGTGQIECTKWVQESLDTEQMGEILVGMYVRVHGHLRGLQGRRFLNVFSIRPVTDFNEIPGHFIECIYVHFYNTRLQEHRGSSLRCHCPSAKHSNE